jgi:hypothetical protein
MLANEVFWVSDRISTIFYSREFTRNGSANSATPTGACVACPLPATATPTPLPATATPTPLPATPTPTPTPTGAPTLTPTPTPLPATPTPTPSPTPTVYTVRIYGRRSSSNNPFSLFYGINNAQCPSGGNEVVSLVGDIVYTINNVAPGTVIYLAATDGTTGTGAPIWQQCTQVATNTYCVTYSCSVASFTINADTDISMQGRTNIATCGTMP